MAGHVHVASHVDRMPILHGMPTTTEGYEPDGDAEIDKRLRERHPAASLEIEV